MSEPDLRKLLASYVPRLIQKRIVADPTPIESPVLDEDQATILFVDISGFTGLIEKLAESGPAGVEAIANILNEYFGQLIDIIHKYGGDVVKFAGDAVIAVWPIETTDETSDSVFRADQWQWTMRAAECALEIRERFSNYKVENESIYLKLAISTGDVTTAHVGGVFNRWEFLLMGNPLVEVGLATDLANADDILITPSAWKLISNDCDAKDVEFELKDAIAQGGQLKSLNKPSSIFNNPAEPEIPDGAETSLRPYIPGAIINRLTAGQSSWIAELRRVTVLYVSLPDIDQNTKLADVQNLARLIQRSVYRYEGSINKINADDKGITVVAAFGLPPFAHEDDPARGVQAALMIHKELVKLKVQCFISITTSRLFCGSIGNESRREYTMIGNKVNLAARLVNAMASGFWHGAKFDLQILCDRITYENASELMEFEQVPLVDWQETSELFYPLKEKSYDVYLSYNSHDRPDLAIGLATRLRDLGINVWIDQWFLKPGDNWVSISQGVLKQTSAVLIMIGPKGIGQRGQTTELDFILSSKVKGIIPALLPDATVDDLPTSLKDYIYLDFTSGLTDAEIENRLIPTISIFGRKSMELPPYPGTRVSSEEITISVKPGETLSSIALKYHTTVDVILQANPEISNPNLISSGQVMKIPIQTVEEKSTSTLDSPAPSPPPPTEDRLSEKSKPTTSSPPGGESDVATDSSVALGDIQVGGNVSGNIVIHHDYKESPTDPAKKSSSKTKNEASNTNIKVGDISDISGEVNIASGNIIKNFRDVDSKVRSQGNRLINAGFAHSNNEPLNRDRALSSNSFYNLLVDVGPLWGKNQTIVVESDKAYFPEEKLPPNQQGYQVRVVFVSEDFFPHLSTSEMWVPEKQGQSHPFVDGKRADEPGPVKMRVRAPRLGLFEREGRAYGRLCLYYKGQLIQSALVSVAVAKFKVGKLKEPNKVEVDYVLSRDFDEPNRFSDRRVNFGDGESRPVSVGLTLNDDGSGRHRILATYHLNSKEETTVPPAWAPYDSQSAQQTLLEFRNVMADCYKGLSDTFGKNRKDFSYDLLELAKLGDQLRTLALSGLDVSESGKTVAIWRQGLFDALKTGTVIQIARTGPANYVFPWALVYDIPLPEPDKVKLCKVIEEWNENGIREKDAEMGCPYQEEEWHKQNIICPYGFWGLKHIIEQPTGAIHKQNNRSIFDVTDKILIGKDVDLGVGATNDIDQTARDSHLNRLVTTMRAHLNPLQPAYDRDNARIMLQAPEIIYFLCHGEVDTKQTPYLSIGEHIIDPNYSIYPNTLEQWSYRSLNLPHWQHVRPLVFINGCHTTQLQPGIVLNFVSAFADLGASGVIGTEVSVRADMAMAIAEAILTRIGNDMEIGQAVREMRWEMANRGNILGLAYTPYCLANLHIERDN